MVQGANFSIHVSRALLDSGAKSNFTTTEFAHKLKLPFHKISISLIGVNETQSIAYHMVIEHVSSRFNACNAKLNCYVLSQIIFLLSPIKRICSMFRLKLS